MIFMKMSTISMITLYISITNMTPLTWRTKTIFMRRSCILSKNIRGGGGYTSEYRSFLDIGCGEGFALQYFYNAGWSVTGVDFSSYGITVHNPSMKKFLLQGDFEKIINELHSQGKTFDFINSDNVLEHLPEPEKFFESVKKVSNDNTMLCVTVPNDFSRIQKLAYENGFIDGAFWVDKETSEHFSYFSVDSLSSLGYAAGYEKLIATAKWPIDFFLLHNRTNYRKDNAVGHDCHIACTLLENSIYDESMDIAVNLFKTLADAGVGREISVYFKMAKGR
ncbi:MAG: class I SAM-dependent methyltransferase [Selenomonadaceae bacterium]|nr:class I SAM-dependent methyltransferase [Selenomonadaceae bacterium]